MHVLKVLTKPGSGNEHIVHWTNTITPRGSYRVSVPVEIEDAPIIAELYVLQHLLEVKEVVGANSAGSPNIKLVVSFGAIKKLNRKSSDKTHMTEYAKFLTTRWKDCVIEVDKDESWLGEYEPSESLDATSPLSEYIDIHGFGRAVLTSHVVEQYHERFEKELFGDAWRKLTKTAREDKIIEIDKNNPQTRMKYAIKGKGEGRYFYHPNKQLMMVVSKTYDGTPAMVTAYKTEFKQ